MKGIKIITKQTQMNRRNSKNGVTSIECIIIFYRFGTQPQVPLRAQDKCHQLSLILEITFLLGGCSLQEKDILLDFKF